MAHSRRRPHRVPLLSSRNRKLSGTGSLKIGTKRCLAAMNLDLWCSTQTDGSGFGINKTKARIHPAFISTIQVGGVIVLQMCFFYGKLWTSCCLWPCPSLYNDSVPIFKWLFSAGEWAQWYPQYTPQSPHLNPIEHPWDVGERAKGEKRKKEKRLHELHNSFMPVRTKISEECFQNLAESMPQRIYAALKAKRGLKLKNNHVWYTGTHKSLSKWVKFIFIALFETRNGHKLLYRGNLIKSSPRQRQSGHTWMKKNNIVSVWTHEF